MGTDPQLPDKTNVFGYVTSANGLEPVASALRSALGLSPNYVRTRRSGFDGTETLWLERPNCELEASPSERAGVWFFNGCVAGEPDEIFDTLLPMVQDLQRAGFSASFEIYDMAGNLVRNCPSPASERESPRVQNR